MTQYFGMYEGIKSDVHDSIQDVYNELMGQAREEGVYNEDMFGNCVFYEAKNITDKLLLEPAKVKIVKPSRTRS